MSRIQRRVLRNFTPLDRVFTAYPAPKWFYISRQATPRKGVGGNMKSYWKMLAATLALGVAASIAAAQGTGPHGHDGLFSHHMMEFFTDYLNLTDAQQTQIKAIAEKERPAGEPLMQQMMQGHQ